VLLRRAWTLHDLFTNHALFYKRAARWTFFFMLLMGVLVVFITTLSALVGKDNLPSNWVTQERNLLLAISFGNTFITGCVAFLEPTRKWTKLRGAALTIKSEIWKFRTRMGDYSGGIDALSTLARNQAESAVQRRFANFLNYIQESVKQGAGLSRSDLYAIATTSPDTLVPRGRGDLGNTGDRFKGLLPALPKNKSTRAIKGAFDKVSGSLPRHLRDPDYIKHGQFRLPGQRPLDHDEDNFHSPALPDDYIRFRLIPMRDYYQQRIPGVWRKYFFCQVFLIIASVASALIAATSQVAATAIVASLAGGVKAWQEFTAVEQKLDRCSTVANALENTLQWWQGLPEEEKKVKEHISSLVMTTEGHVASETASFVRDAQVEAQRLLNRGSDQNEKTQDSQQN